MTILVDRLRRLWRRLRSGAVRSHEAEQANRNESAEEQRNLLAANWLLLRQSLVPPLPEEVVSEIEARLQPPSTIASLNVVEQLIASQLSGPVLDETIERRLAEAKRRGLPDAGEVAARYAGFVSRGVDASYKRALLHGLVIDLQHFGLRATQIRKLRAIAIATVGRWTIWAVFAAVFPFVVFVVFRAWPTSDFSVWLARLVTTFPNYGLYTAVSFGVIGALFSRYIRFQDAAIVSVPLDDADLYYSKTNLVLHVLIGTVGAMIIYFVAAARLITGPLVPDVGELTYLSANVASASGPRCDFLADTVDCVAVLGSSPKPARPAIEAVNGITTVLGLRTPNALVPSTDLALLIIWAILAGFSERLVPNILASTSRQIEIRVQQADQKSAGATPTPPPQRQPTEDI